MLFGRLLVDTAILRQLILGAAMLLIMLFRPKGLWPRPEHKAKKHEMPAISSDTPAV